MCLPLPQPTLCDAQRLGHIWQDVWRWRVNTSPFLFTLTVAMTKHPEQGVGESGGWRGLQGKILFPNLL